MKMRLKKVSAMDLRPGMEFVARARNMGPGDWIICRVSSEDTFINEGKLVVFIYDGLTNEYLGRGRLAMGSKVWAVCSQRISRKRRFA